MCIDVLCFAGFLCLGELKIEFLCIDAFVIHLFCGVSLDSSKDA